MADSCAAAEPASREAALQTAVHERNKAWWADMHGKMLFALIIRHQGESQDTNDFVVGLQNDWTPASAIRFFANNDPIARHLRFSILPEEDLLNWLARVGSHLLTNLLKSCTASLTTPKRSSTLYKLPASSEVLK